MGLPCIHCSKSFPPGHTFEFIVYDEGAYFFCSEECKDKWVSVNAPEIGLENLQQTTL
jgi:ribosomal protein L24E